MSTSANALLQIDSVGKRFGGLRVINDVTFDITAGVRTALIGPNGAGKTTLFNLISGAYTTDEGTIELDGQDITRVPAQARIGAGVARTFQNIRLMPHLSTLENVMLGQHAVAGVKGLLYPLGWGRNRWVAAAEGALIEAGLETYPGQIVADLPYGIQKRIEVVRALMAQPKLLLLDEPAAGLNPLETDELLALLERISERGVTLLVVEHDMKFVRQLCSDVVVLNFGRMIYHGTPQGAQCSPAVLEAYLGPGYAA